MVPSITQPNALPIGVCHRIIATPERYLISTWILFGLFFWNACIIMPIITIIPEALVFLPANYTGVTSQIHFLVVLPRIFRKKML